MSSSAKRKSSVRVLASNPLEGEQLLLDAMFGSRPAPRRPRPVERAQPKPKHYKIVSISLYREDIERLDRIVRTLKARGHTKANKSQVIRQALMQIELDDIANGR